MANTIKLLRLPGNYTTGDLQDRTYEYTWEDFARADLFRPKETEPEKSVPDPKHELAIRIIMSFEDCPEKALDPKHNTPGELSMIKSLISQCRVFYYHDIQMSMYTDSREAGY